jgi:hypothetical protein
VFLKLKVLLLAELLQEAKPPKECPLSFYGKRTLLLNSGITTLEP